MKDRHPCQGGDGCSGWGAVWPNSHSEQDSHPGLPAHLWGWEAGPRCLLSWTQAEPRSLEDGEVATCLSVAHREKRSVGPCHPRVPDCAWDTALILGVQQQTRGDIWSLGFTCQPPNPSSSWELCLTLGASSERASELAQDRAT